MDNQIIEVELLGKTVKVSCPVGQEDSLITAAVDLNNRLNNMQSRTKIGNEVQLLMFTALNINHELQNSIYKNDDLQNKVAKQEAIFHKVETMTELLDKSLADHVTKRQVNSNFVHLPEH